MNTKIAYKLVVLVILTAVFLSACGAGGFGSKPTNTPQVVRIATDATYPPFETVNETSKEMEGFDMDLIREIAKETGLNIEIVNLNFDSLLAGMAQCQYDAALSAITITEERSQSMSFSDPYINAGQIVTVNMKTNDINGPQDLTGKKIGAQIATTGAIEAEKLGGSEVKTYDTVDLAFQDLINRQIDAVVTDYPTSLAFVQVNAEDLKVVGEAFTNESYGIAVCKNKPELLATLNKGLATVKANGFVASLEKKWLAGE